MENQIEIFQSERLQLLKQKHMKNMQYGTSDKLIKNEVLDMAERLE